MPTPNFNLPLYTTSDTAALDTLLNGQSNAIDTALAANLYRLGGTDAARTALAAPKLKEGLEFRATDTDRDWFYDGTTWLSADNGCFLIRPTSVVGGAVNAGGLIVPTHGGNGNTTPLSLNGIFSSRFRTYRIEYMYKTSATAGAQFRFRATGADNSSLFYSYQNIVANNTLISGSESVNANIAPVAGFTATDHFGFLEFVGPQVSGMIKGWRSQDFSGAIDYTCQQGMFHDGGANAYTADGISFILSSSVTWVSAGDISWFKVYGYA